MSQSFLAELDVDVEPDMVLEAMGYQTDVAPPRVRHLTDQSIAEATRLSEPRAVARRLPLTRRDGRFGLAGDPIRSRSLSRVLEPCTHAVVFVATLGPELDDEIAAACDVSSAEAFVLDAAASSLAEAAAAAVQDEAESLLEPGESLTLRYSPGYCDWPVSEQGILFRHVDASRVGVGLNAHRMMRPRKSVSGLMGIGPAELVEGNECACDGCPRTDCRYRRNT